MGEKRVWDNPMEAQWKKQAKIPKFRYKCRNNGILLNERKCLEVHAERRYVRPQIIYGLFAKNSFCGFFYGRRVQGRKTHSNAVRVNNPKSQGRKKWVDEQNLQPWAFVSHRKRLMTEILTFTPVFRHAEDEFIGYQVPEAVTLGYNTCTWHQCKWFVILAATSQERSALTLA